MKDRIRITVSADHTFECSTNVIGRAGESETARLEIAVPTKLSDWWTYVEFRKPNGETFRTSNLEVESGVATYNVPLYLLSEDGEIDVQLVFQHESGKVWKSTTKKYIIDGSINATDDIPIKEDFWAQAQALVDVLSGEVQEIADTLADNSAFADAVIEACGGQTKVNTIDGQALKFWVGTQKEYDDLFVKDPMTLYYIEDDDTLEEIKDILNGITPVGLSRALYTEDAYNVTPKLDDLFTAGRYWCNPDCVTPTGHYGFLEVFRIRNNIMQVFYDYSAGDTYIRRSIDGAPWDEWKRGSYAKFASMLAIANASNNFALDTVGLYLVERLALNGVTYTDLIFVTDLTKQVLSTSEDGSYYDCGSKMIKTNNGTILNAIRIANYFTSMS